MFYAVCSCVVCKTLVISERIVSDPTRARQAGATWQPSFGKHSRGCFRTCFRKCTSVPQIPTAFICTRTSLGATSSGIPRFSNLKSFAPYSTAAGLCHSSIKSTFASADACTVALLIVRLPVSQGVIVMNFDSIFVAQENTPDRR